MEKRLALVLLEQQHSAWTPRPLAKTQQPEPAVPALFSPWDAFQTLAETWMRLLTGLWSWFGTPLLRGA
jgi:hypothetical protein